MTDVTETPLPGVGLRHEFRTRNGRVVGVVSHRTGRRDLVFYDPVDPDAASDSVELTEDEARLLGEMLGGSRIVEHLDELVHDVEGLTIEWVQVGEDSEFAGKTLEEVEMRTRTGASVVALVRGDVVVPAPGASDRLEAGGTVVVVGTRETADAACRLLRPNG